MTHLSFQREPALPLIMHAVTSACCVSTPSWCAPSDIFCQSFAAPTTPLQYGLVAHSCHRCVWPLQNPGDPPRLDSALAALLSFSFFFRFLLISDTQQTTFLGLGSRRIFAGVLIFYIFTWTQILADLQSVPNCDPWEFGWMLATGQALC